MNIEQGIMNIEIRNPNVQIFKTRAFTEFSDKDFMGNKGQILRFAQHDIRVILWVGGIKGF